MNKTKRFLGLFLIVFMLLAFVPLQALANTVDEIAPAGSDSQTTEVASATDETQVAMVNGTGYATLAEALEAAKALTGDVTVEIYDKVTLNSAISGSFDSITFVGKDTDAEIYLDVQGYITATGKKVAFEDLTLSKSAGGFITNAGFMNVAFGVYDVVSVDYTNCVFANGAYASSGDVTFTKCTFYRSHDKYGLWAYGDTNAVVDNCVFNDYRGIKMYAEGAAKTTDLTVKNTDFSAVNDKPAIVLTYGESVTLEGNTYSSTGTFELDLDGAPNGVAVTSDVAPTCKNDNGACGVLVDGKIYTTVEQAAAVAESGSTVTLLHASTETVELAEGVTLDKNGFEADGVTVAAPAVVLNAQTVAGTIKFEPVKGDTIGYVLGRLEVSSNLFPLAGGIKIVEIDVNSDVVETENVTIKYNTVIKGTGSVSGTLVVAEGAVLTIDAAVEIDNLTVVDANGNVIQGVNGVYTPAKPVASINGVEYATLEEAFAAAAEGNTIVLLGDATPALTSQRAITKASVIDLGGYTLTLTEDDLYFGTTTFKNGTIVVDPSVKPSTAVFWMFANQTLTFDGVKLVATGVTGTYLIGLDGNNSDLNIINGSEIVVENTTALDLDIICVNASTGNDIVVDNSKVNVTNLDGRVFFRGNYTISGTSEIVLEGITKAGIRIEAGQTLSIEDTASVTITGEPRDGGIHITDATATYTKADTATVNATVNAPAVAQIGDVKYATLQDALNAGGEVVLLTDIVLTETVTVPAGTSVTLNLNGKTISQSKECTASYEMISNKGNLTITGDGKISFTDTSAGDATYSWGSYTIRNEGTLVVENGTIEHNGTQAFATHMICAIFQYSGSTTINGGTISTPNYRSVRLWKGEMTINGGTFDGQVWVQAVDNSANLAVNGGTFEPNGKDASSVFVSNATYDVEFVVTDGTFNGKIGVSDADALAGAVTGGTFSAAAKNGTSVALLSTGLSFGEANEDGYYELEQGLAGSGTEEDPYLITSFDDLKLFRDLVNNGTYVNVYAVLTDNIDMEQEDWVSIGTSTHPFTGTFDGKGFTISNIWSYERGLFGYTSKGNYVDSGLNGRATIKNLTINGVEVYNQTTSAVGGLVGQAGQNTEISNVTVTGYISIYGYGYVGGIVGQGYAHIDNCQVIGVDDEYDDQSTISANYWAVGGIIGHAGSEGGASITNCSVENVKIYSAIYGAGSIAGVGTTGPIENVSAENVVIEAGSDPDANGFLVGCNYDKITGNSTAKNITMTVGDAVVSAPQDMVANVNGTYYISLQAAVDAANTGDTITILANVADEAVTVNKNVTITSDADNKVTLNNVSITINGTDVELTVSNLKFTGSSYINAGNGKALTVTGVEANVEPAKITGRAAFIVTGTSEPTHGLKLVVTDNVINSAQSGTDYYSAAIFGWRYIDDGSVISGNTFGTEDNRYTFVAVKTMNAMDGATITIANNTIYGTSESYVLLAFDLYQNNSRANVYTVISNSNVIDATVGSSYPVIAFNISGNTAFADSTNITLLDNGTTVNGNALTLADIDANDAGSDYDKYYGVDVVTDANGKIIGGTFGGDMAALANDIADGYEVVDGVVSKVQVAEVNGVKYATLAEAAAAAQAGDEIVLLADAYIAEGTDVTIPAGVILNGNGFSIYASGADYNTTTNFGYVVAGGNLTIKGITKIEKFSASYYDHVITIGEGASLQVFGKNRVSLGYGSSFDIVGSIDDAKTADKSAVTPSLVISAGISIVGANDTYLKATNAYVVIGSTSSKNSNAGGTFDITFDNCIVEFTNQFTTVTPKYDTLNPVFNVTFKDSTVTATTKFCFMATGSNVVVDNSDVTLGSYLHNSGNIVIKNGSTFVGSMIQYGENGGNSGTITVDNASFTINNNNVAYAMDGKDTGKLILTNGATASVDYIKATEITIGVGTELTTKSADLTANTEPGYEVEYADGKYVAVLAPVAQIGDVKYATLQDALNAGGEVVLLTDIVLTEKVTVPEGTSVTLDLAGHTVSREIASAEKSTSVITNYGTLTVKDSSGNNSGKISINYTGASYGYGVGIYAISNEGGTLTIAGGTIENLTPVSGSMYDAIDNNSTLGNTVLNIEGGIISCPSYIGIRQFCNGTANANVVNVSNGAITGGNTSIWMQNPNNNDNSGALNITGGTFNGRLLVGSSAVFAPAVSGGTFSVAVPEEYCADGFIPTSYVDDEGNTVYGVKEGTFVAEVNGVGYEDLQEAIVAAAPSGTVEILSDVTVDKWIMFSETLNISSGQIITIDINGLTINGNGHTLTVNSIESASNGNCLFYDATELNIKNLTINYANGVAGGIGLTSGTIENVTFNGGTNNVYPGNGGVTITGCTFNNTNGYAIYYENARENIVITGNTFNTASGAYAITMRSNEEFANNTIISGRVNIANSSSATVTGNNFGTERFKVYNGATATVENNEINNLVFNETTVVTNSTFGTNTLSESAEAALEAVSTGVAKLNGVVYTSLQAAIDAAQNGDTIVLLANVAGDFVVNEGQSIIIDLNGYDIVGSNHAITNNGTLVINDTVGTGNVYTTDVSAQGRATIVNNGTITINGGWFGDSNNDTTDRNAINRGNAIKNYGTATINGGYFTNVSNQYIDANAYAYAINTLSSGTTIINNATVYGDINGLIFSDGKTIVNDGSFTLGRPGEENNLWYLAYGDVEINGGTWTRAFAVPSWNTGDPTFEGAVQVSGGTFNVNVKEQYCAEGCGAIQNLDGKYVVGELPTATVNNLGPAVIPEGDWTQLSGGAATGSLPLSFVMQFLADQDATDMATSPYADWYADFVITFTGIENGSFTADGCYLAGYYGDFGWIKVPVDGMTVEEGARYPVMLGYGAGQKYDYICESVKDFRCALYLTPEILAANPNLEVNLELAVVDNSKGSDAALQALVEGTSHNVADIDYVAKDFVIDYVAQIGDKKFASLADAIAAAVEGDTIVLLDDVTVDKDLEIAADKSFTLDLAGYDITAGNDQVNLVIKGKLTIEDSIGGGVSTFRNHKVYGELVLENGTIQNISTLEAGFAVLLYGGKFTLNDGTVQSVNTSNYAISSFDVDGNAEIVINGGIINGKRGCLAVECGTYAIVNGGEFNVTDAIGGHCVYVTDATIEINDGIFYPYPTNACSSYAVFAYNAAASVTINGGVFNASAPASNVYASAGAITIGGGEFALEPISTYLKEGYGAIKDLDGYYVVGEKPTATVNNLGSVVIPEGEWTQLSGGTATGDLPLSFVMQFLADQDAADMETSPYADWYADFVITFTGIENGSSFTADGCYLAGYYGDFGWIKVPVDGMTVEEGARYPVMLGYGAGQKYDYICESVKDFRCALFLTPEILAANPNLEVNLELAVVDNSKGSDAALQAMIEGTSHNVADIDYVAKDFVVVAQVGDKLYASLQEAIDAAGEGDTITLLADITVVSDFNNAAKGLYNIAADDEITIDLNGKTINVTDNSTGNFIVFYNYGELTIKNGTVNVTSTNNRLWDAQSTIILNRGGILTIESGSYVHNGGTDMAITVDNSGNSFGDAYLYVNGGTIESTYVGIRLRMADPTLNGNPGNGLVYTEITDGEIYGGSRGIWAQITNATSDELGSLAITGGTIGGGNNSLRITTDGHENIDVTISGDVVINGAILGEGSDFAITGGTFDTPVAAELCADGYIPCDNGDGTYGVKLGKYVATVNGVGYETVTEAIKAANDGDTVQLLAGTITETINPWGTDSTHASEKSITIVGADNFGTTLTGGLVLGYDDSGCRAHTITIKGIVFEGMGVVVAGQQTVVIEGNKFTDITAAPVSASSANANAISVIGKNVNATVTDNIIDGVAVAGINLRDILNATVSGNTITNTQHNSITITTTSGSAGTVNVNGNNLSDWGLGGEGRAVRISGGNIVYVYNNVMTYEGDAPEEFVKVTNVITGMNLSQNYWNGKSPLEEGVFEANVAPSNYYADAEFTTLIKIAKWTEASLTFGSDLKMNFYLTASSLDSTASYVKIVKTHADGCTDTEEVIYIDVKDWFDATSKDGVALKKIVVEGIAAKEMNCTITAQIFAGTVPTDGAAEGTALSAEVGTSVVDYALYLIREYDGADAAAVKTFAVDMLNYGAAAQEYFHHYEDKHLANADLDEAEKALATPTVDENAVETIVYGKKAYADKVTVEMETSIYLNFYFNNLENLATDYDKSKITAVVSYTDHYDNDVVKTFTAADLVFSEDGGQVKVSVQTLAPADASLPVMCVLYYDQAAITAVSSSISAYCEWGMSEEDVLLNALCEKIMKYSQSAYNYFHTQTISDNT